MQENILEIDRKRGKNGTELMAGLRPLGEAAKALQCKDRGGFSHMQEV